MECAEAGFGEEREEEGSSVGHSSKRGWRRVESKATPPSVREEQHEHHGVHHSTCFMASPSLQLSVDCRGRARGVQRTVDCRGSSVGHSHDNEGGDESSRRPYLCRRTILHMPGWSAGGRQRDDHAP